MPGSRARLVATGVAVVVLVAMSVVAWAGDSQDPRPAAAGSSLFLTKGCVGCHDTGVGPGLASIHEVAAGRVPALSADEYVRESILDPGAYTVPGYTSGAMPALPLDDEEVDALVAFLLDQGRSR